MSYTPGTFTGTLSAFSGTRRNGGKVLFIPSVDTVRDTAGKVVMRGTETAAIVNGVFTISLPPTDDASLDPTGFTYTIVPPAEWGPPVSGVALPGGSTRDYADLVSTNPADPTYQPGDVTRGELTGVSGRVTTLETLTGSGRLSDATLSTTFAGVRKARPGNLAAFLGSSVTLAADDVPSNARGDCFPVYTSIISGQRIRYLRNAGKAGENAAQMLARFDTDITPFAPNIVFFESGPNDLNAGGPTLTAWLQTVAAVVAKIRAIGATPVLMTMPPNSTGSPVDRKQKIIQWNNALRGYAAQEEIHLIDFYDLLTDPTNSNFKTAYNSDGTHPSPKGGRDMGDRIATQLAGLLPLGGPILCQDDVDENSALYKGCFGGYSGTGLPTGYVDNAGVPSGSALSYTTDAAVRGQMLTITSAGTTGVRQLAYTIALGTQSVVADVAAGGNVIHITGNPFTRGVLFIGSGSTAEIAKVSSVSGSGSDWTVTLTRNLRFAHTAGETVIVNGTAGDKMRMSGIVTTDGGVPVTVKLTGTGTNVSPMSALTQAITRGTFLGDVVIPASVPASLSAQLQAGAGTGVVSFGQVGVYNVTRLGLPL